MPHDLTPSNTDESLALRAVDMLRRRKILAILAAAAVMASAVSFALYLPNLFRATAVLLVEKPVTDHVGGPSAGGELESRLHVIKQEVLSRDRLSDLITRFGLYPELRKSTSMEDVLEQMRQDIEVELNGPEQQSGRKTTVSFRLSYRGDSATQVAAVTNAVAAFYVAGNDRIRSEAAIRTTELLKTQLDSTKRRLDEQQQAIRGYTSSHSGELPQQVAVNLAAIERLNTQLRLSGERQLKLMENREKLLESLAAVPDSAMLTLGDPAAERLEELRRQRKQLEGSFTSRYPDVVSLDAEIAALERGDGDPSISGQDAGLRNQPVPSSGAAALAVRRRTIEALENEMGKLKSDEAALRLSISNVERRLEEVPQREQDFVRLTRDYQATKELYDSLLKRYDEAQLAENMEIDRQGERFRILEGAVAPPGPIAPNRVRLILLGLMLAAAAAAAVILTAEQFDQSFHSADDLRDFTRVPVLVSIPSITRDSARQVLRVTLATASVLAVVALMTALSTYAARGNDLLVRMFARGG